MTQTFVIKKPLNNNVVIAEKTTGSEVVLSGKGIGFGQKPGNTVNTSRAEKIFVLENESERHHFTRLVDEVNDDKLMDAIYEAMAFIEKETHTELLEHTQVALTDHLAYTIKRIRQGMSITNPFLTDIQALYPAEYEVALGVITLLNKNLKIDLPDSETGYIALHIHSATTQRSLSDLNLSSQLINTFISFIEKEWEISIDRSSLPYLRLARHIRYTVERIKSGTPAEEATSLKRLLQTQYPLCYNLAWKLVKIMQRKLGKPVDEAEAVYLTIHLQRFSKKQDK